jgi:hypothetical protein
MDEQRYPHTPEEWAALSEEERKRISSPVETTSKSA